jgi:hypothetical protein
MAVKLTCEGTVVELLEVTDILFYKMDRPGTMLTLRHVRVTTVAVEK